MMGPNAGTTEREREREGRSKGVRAEERESVERFAREGEGKKGSERRFAAKHSRSVDGKRTTIWCLCSASLLPI